MSDLDQTALVEITTEVVAAYVTKNSVRPADMPALIATVHERFSGLGQAPAPEAPVEAPKPAVPIRKSITDGYLVCLDAGKHFASLKRHLAKLGMTPTDYRTKWRLPALAKSMGLGAQRRKR